MSTESVSRRKVAPAHYRLVSADTEVEAVQDDDGPWIVRSLDGRELAVTDRLTDAEEMVAEGEIEAEPLERVAWTIPSNPASKLHLTADGETTLCSVPIPEDRELDAEPRGDCGRCFG